MVENHSPATIAVTHASIPTVVLAEKCLGVTQKQDLVALDTVDLAPRVHDPRIVGRNCGDDVDALVLELLGLGNVGWQVVCLAAGSEGTGNGEDDDFLVCPLLASIVLLRAATCGGVAVRDGGPSIERESWLAFIL